MNKLKVLFLAILATVATACAEKPKEERPYVAVIAPMTGPAAVYGQWIRGGIKSAVEDGVSNVEFELLDSGGDPKTAVTLARKAMDKSNVVAVWATTSGENMAVRDLVTGAGLSLITSSATSPEITDGRDGVFRTIVNTRQETKALVDFTRSEFKPRQVSLLFINDAGGQAARDQFQQDFASAGIKIALIEAFEKTVQDFRTLAQKSLAAKPDVVVVTGYTGAMGQLIHAIRSLDPVIPIICNHGLDTPENMSLPKSVLNNIFFSVADTGDNTEKTELAKSYKQNMGEAPGIYVIGAYDTAKMLSESIRASGSDKLKLRDTMRALNFTGANGNYRFTPQGNVLKPLAIYHLDQGAKTKISTITPKAD